MKKKKVAIISVLVFLMCGITGSCGKESALEKEAKKVADYVNNGEVDDLEKVLFNYGELKDDTELQDFGRQIQKIWSKMMELSRI